MKSTSSTGEATFGSSGMIISITDSYWPSSNTTTPRTAFHGELWSEELTFIYILDFNFKIIRKTFYVKWFVQILQFKFDGGKFSALGCGCAQLYFELLILIFSNRDLNLRARGRWSSRPPSPAEPRAENNDVHSAWTPTTQRVIKYLFNYF